MRISPLDIRKQSFKKSMRGVDAEEVRIFLELVASEYEKVLQENAMMAERLQYQEDRLVEYRELEKSMRNSLVTADRIAAEARESSERESQRIVQDAHLRAERILEDARERLQGLVREIESLKARKEIYARRFWALVESQIGVLQEHMQDAGEVEALRKRVEQLTAEGSPGAPHSSTERGEPALAVAEEEPASNESAAAVRDSRGAETLASPPASRDAGRDSSSGAADGKPAKSERPKGLPRGLSRLLRARQQPQLPLDDSRREPGATASNPAAAPEEGFFPLRERREGSFRISARDSTNDAEPAGEHGPPRER